MPKSLLFQIKGALSDTSLEHDLVRTLRHRYKNRDQARLRQSGTKFIKQAIRQLRTYRQNRSFDPERHAELDRQLMGARKGNFLRYEHDPNFDEYARTYNFCYYQLTQRAWDKVEIPTFDNPEQITLF